jgi:hypothetical protein
MHVISAASLIPAPPERVYATIADYRNGHPHILPNNSVDWRWRKVESARGPSYNFK